MKNPIRALALGIALVTVCIGSASAVSYVTENSTQNVTTSNTAFTFSRFNPSLGTLSAIDLIINSSTPTGSITAVNNTPSSDLFIDAVSSRFRITANSTIGLSAYNPLYTDLSVNPDVSGTYTVAGGNSQAFAVDPSQSLIGGTPVTRPISSSAFAQYLGFGSINILGSAQNLISATGATYTVDSTSYYAVTSMTLRYTYTPTAPVPEPGQVAASVLLLGGIGSYYFVKRRRKTAPVAT